MTKTLTRIGIGLAGLTLSAPLVAFAVTPQQTLNQAIINFTQQGPQKIDATIDINVTNKPLIKNGPTGSSTIRMHLTERTLAKQTDHQDSEGRVVIDPSDLSGLSSLPIKLDTPIAFQWRVVDKSAYLLVEPLPDSIMALLKTQGIDLSSFINQWIRIDGQAETTLKGTTDVDSLTKLAQKYPILLVNRVESSSKNAAGENVMRLRVRINPLFVNALQRTALQQIPKNDPFRSDRIKSVNTSFASTRKTLAKMSMVAVLNMSGRIERVELGGSETKPHQLCTENTRTRRTTCRKDANETTKYAVGITFQKDAGLSVEVPSDAKSFEQLINEMTSSTESIAP